MAGKERRRVRRRAGLLLACALVAKPAYAAEIFFEAVPDSSTCGLHIEGELRPGDSERLARLLVQNPGRFLAAESVSLDSPGGAEEEGLRVAAMLSDAGLAAEVGSSAVCGGSCAVIYLSAPARTSDGPVLLHAPAPESDQAPLHPRSSQVEAKRAVSEIETHLSAKGVPEDLIAKLATLPADRAHAMTAGDYRRAGVLGPAVEKAAVAACRISNRDLAGSGQTDGLPGCLRNEVLYPMRLAFLSRVMGADAVESLVARDLQDHGSCTARVDVRSHF